MSATPPADRPRDDAAYFARLVPGPVRDALRAEASRMSRERLAPFVPRPAEGTKDAAR